MATEITDGNINEKIAENDITIIDFWAEWCGPCKTLGPIIDELSERNPDVTVGKLNIDMNPTTAGLFGIRSIPTVIVFQGGQTITKIGGAQPITAYQQLIDDLIK